ncbi:monofunctional C1-tetrahydrofolate synthase, mitochondrial-like [Anguilla rostrata]|uniref:monofunctional C1-tetrahydrofolate synthase, mitochondrial-like n=1 Tax=Anguilla rostrata TaxID=7938 RepID=UPI0030D04393
MRLSGAFRNACRGFPTGSVSRPRTGVRVFASKGTSVRVGSSQIFTRDGSSSGGGRSAGAAVKFGKHHEQAAASSYDISLRELMQRTKEEITSLQKRYPALKPVLAIIQAGEDDALVEVNKNLAGKIGLDVIQISLPKECTEDEIIEEVLKLNEDCKVHGVALHLPQPSLTRRVLDSLKPEKDVDGVTDLNIGRLVRGDVVESFVPPVASAVVELLGRHGEDGQTSRAKSLPPAEPTCYSDGRKDDGWENRLPSGQGKMRPSGMGGAALECTCSLRTGHGHGGAAEP